MKDVISREIRLASRPSETPTMANFTLAKRADEVYLMVSGIKVKIK